MVAFLGAGLYKLNTLHCALWLGGHARLIRGQVLKVREYDFVQLRARLEPVTHGILWCTYYATPFSH